MTDDINRPEVVTEVRAALERYNRALEVRDVATLNELFWESSNTVRFGFGENLFGHDEIVRYRGSQWQHASERNVVKVVITTIGQDCAATSLVLDRGDKLSRQSQTWARRPEGWRIVAAHVSVLKK